MSWPASTSSAHERARRNARRSIRLRAEPMRAAAVVDAAAADLRSWGGGTCDQERDMGGGI